MILVLDIDETLVHTCRSCCSHYSLRPRLITDTVSGNGYYMFIRNGIRELVELCKINEIKIIVYSAADIKYIYDVLHILNIYHDIDMVLDRTKLNSNENKTFEIVRKEYRDEDSRMIAVDDNELNFRDTKDDFNITYYIEAFYLGKEDNAIYKLIEYLKITNMW